MPGDVSLLTLGVLVIGLAFVFFRLVDRLSPLLREWHKRQDDNTPVNSRIMHVAVIAIGLATALLMVYLR